MASGFSILDRKECPHTDAPRAAFFTDLNLDQIIGLISAQWGTKVKDFYRYFPLDEECEAYRRAVYGDVKKEPVYRALCVFLENAKGMEIAEKQKQAVLSPVQKAAWHLREIESYCLAFETLGEELSRLQPQSEGFQKFTEILTAYLKTDGYRNMKEQTENLLKKLSGIRLLLTYEKDRIAVSEGTAPGDYENFVRENGDPEAKPFQNPFRGSPGWTNLERECLEILIRKEPELFRNIQKCAVQYENFQEEDLTRFLAEIPFYLSFCGFQREMAEQGYVFAAPSVNREENMNARGLYDLALACAALRDGRKVVSNDMEYGEQESFFVLTGPNQGGKTTFARSLGQLVYFTKMGLDVPAESANVHYFKDILTHFSVEESVETGRGKLKEELVRLAPMMAENCGNCFVVINELFTTAATYDAQIMGKRVLERFIGQGCRGIYVTHLKELASVHPRIVSLRAMLDQNRVQTFQIERSEAEESACAVNQVTKYRLTYEQLKERL